MRARVQAGALLALVHASVGLAAQSARLVEVTPRTLAVGDALQLRIRVEHAPNELLEFLRLDDALGVGWAELERSLRPLPDSSPAAPAGPHAALQASELVLLLAPLESGTLELPRLYVELRAAGAGAKEPLSLPVTVEPDALRVEVAPALAAGEDSARELRPLRDGAAVSAVEFDPWWIAAGCAVLVAAAAAVAWQVRAARARERRTERVPTCDERLAALTLRPADSPAAPLAHELAALLRQAVSELCPALRVRRSGVQRAALTDEEFVDSLEPAAPERERLAALFLRLRAVRYGGAEPTAWAREEWLAESKELLEALRERGTAGLPVDALQDQEVRV